MGYVAAAFEDWGECAHPEAVRLGRLVVLLILI